MLDAYILPLGQLWLAVGIILLLLEVLGVSGAGLLHAGAAALIVGGLIQLHFLSQHFTLTHFLTHCAIWAGLACSFAMMWRVLRKPGKLRHHPEDQSVKDRLAMGEQAIICHGEIVRGSRGQARWSGAIMDAEIDPMADAVRVQDGETVEITQLQGNVLWVRPLGSRRMEEVI